MADPSRNAALRIVDAPQDAAHNAQIRRTQSMLLAAGLSSLALVAVAGTLLAGFI